MNVYVERGRERERIEGGLGKGGRWDWEFIWKMAWGECECVLQVTVRSFLSLQVTASSSAFSDLTILKITGNYFIKVQLN